MQRSPRTWTSTVIRRGLVVAVSVATLAAYGLVSGGQSVAFKPAAASSIGANSQLSVAEAISPTNHSVNVVARGPNNSLLFYWNVAGTWYGPLGLNGANSTYSAPAIAAESDGNFDIVVQGPNHTLWAYWDASGTWYGPYGLGSAGSTTSTPAIQVDQSGHLNVVAQGPSNSLNDYWNVSGTWYGPLGIGGANTTFSAPSLSSGTICCSSHTRLDVFAVGPNNDMREWELTDTSPWNGPREWSNDGTAVSTSSNFSQTSYYAYDVFQGPNHSLGYDDGYATEINVATAGSAYSAPSSVSNTNCCNNNQRLVVQGPAHTLWYYFTTNGEQWQGPAQVGSPGSTYSAPALAQESSAGNMDAVVQGPGNSLWFYWNLGGPWYGPVQIAGGGTTFGSSN